MSLFCISYLFPNNFYVFLFLLELGIFLFLLLFIWAPFSLSLVCSHGFSSWPPVESGPWAPGC